jgi:ABC-type uncharacterized transport system substrate-binding protein
MSPTSPLFHDGEAIVLWLSSELHCGREAGRFGGLLRGIFSAAFTAAVLLGSPHRAWPHPHVWIDAIVELMLDDRHRLAAIRVYWAFDEIYSVIALEEVGVEGDEKVAPDKLALLAKKILKDTEKYGYFTHLKVNGQLVSQQVPREETLYYINHRLLMHFLLPLASPADPRADKVSFAMYDPSYYTAIDFVAKDPVRVNGCLPHGCMIRITEAERDPGDMVPPPESFFQHLDPSIDYGAQFARWVHISCGLTNSLR